MPMTTMQMQVQQPLRFLPTAPSQPLLQMRPMQPLMQGPQPGPAPAQDPGPQAFADHSAVAPKAPTGALESFEGTSQTTESALDDDDLESISELSTKPGPYSSTLLPRLFCMFPGSVSNPGEKGATEEWARAVSYGSSVCPVERTFIQFHTRVAGRHRRSGPSGRPGSI